jgi:hypothetical protein
MNGKNNSSVYFMLIIVCLLGSLTQNIFAQKSEIPKTESAQTTCTGEKFILPPSISAGNDAFANYLKIASLPIKERRIAFRESSNEQKASFFKVQFALQLIKRPNMTREQRDFILDAVSKVSADLYDKGNPENVKLSEQIGQEMENKAMAIFPPKDAAEILAALFENKDEDVALLRKYEDLLKFGTRARRKIAREMPVNDRVNIWKTQLVYHLVTGKFSKAQNEFIMEFLTSLSQNTFASRAHLTKEEEAKALEKLESSIFAVFSKPEAYAIFMEIGIQKPVSDDPNLQAVWCDCRWYCASGGCANYTCVYFPECGPTGTWDCTNKCTNPQP